MNDDELREHLGSMYHELPTLVGVAGPEEADYLRGVHDGQHGRIDADALDFRKDDMQGEPMHRHAHE